MTIADDARSKFHLSLNVADLPAAVEFYRRLFDVEPAKQYEDYAKFELEDPPVVFSLVPLRVPCGGTLANIGMQVSSVEELRAIEARLTAAGVASRLQTDALCGYARQVKLWVRDADGNHWELYVPGEDVDPSLIERSFDGDVAKVETRPVADWEHHLSHGAPGAIPHSDGSLDEVRLLGTFNSDLPDARQTAIVREAWRALLPGGVVSVSGLVADRETSQDRPALPGLAALVARVPREGRIVAELRRAGFVGVQVTKFSAAPVFEHAGVEMRELRATAWKPDAGHETRELLYKGPFASAYDDEGFEFIRGRRTFVPLATWNRLRKSRAADQFLFLRPPLPLASPDASALVESGCCEPLEAERRNSANGAAPAAPSF